MSSEVAVSAGLTFRLYDLHSHTIASDGLFTPTELVKRAVDMRVDILAITDHDSVAGLSEAHQAIRDLNLPLKLINGVEISTNWQNFDIHVVGLNIDPQSSLLQQLLTEQTEHRIQRAEEIGRRLSKKGIPDAYAGACKHANGEIVSRAHFAHYMVEIGIESTVAKVFKKYLSKGKIGYVPPQWCTIEQAVFTIHQAGGQAVLAHPSRYDLSAKWLRRLLLDFKQADGDAIEVAQHQQSNDERKQLALYAQEYGFLASQGSDFHYPCAWSELGRGLWLPQNVTPVWQTWSSM